MLHYLRHGRLPRLKPPGELIVRIIGDGAGKCAEMINSDYASFVQTCPKAESMLVPGCKLLADKQFEDVAYFEPFYLKEFITTVSKKKII